MRYPLALLAAALLSSLAPESATAQTRAQQVVKSTNGAWNVVCVEGRDDTCAMQQIGKGPNGNDALLVNIQSTKNRPNNPGNIPAIIEILTPLGVALEAGVRLQIDGGDERGASYRVCTQQGCLVQSPLDDALLNAMKRGSTARVTIVGVRQGQQPETIAVSISLSGFTRSFGEID
ncbi:MAG: invasion associated locus B family protein [Pseudomonadota bacterium]